MKRPGWTLVWALALAQVVSWGSFYYAFSLFVVPMETELGWGRGDTNGALSLGLLISGLVAYPIGVWVDRHGGRAIMTAGSAFGAALLCVWSQTSSLVLFYVIWAGLGLVLGATLYEPVFVVITRSYPQSYRNRITALTLVGGFASTVFIPLTSLFIDRLGWRDALIALAVANLVVALPIHGLLLRDRDHPPQPSAASAVEAKGADRDAMRRALRHPAFWELAVCFTAYYATFSALTFHLIPLLTERGLSSSTIVGAYAVIGPSQVAGRIVLLAIPGGFSSAVAGRIAVLALPSAVLLLIAFPHSVPALFLFAALYGVGNGILTIVRGTVVPDLMWREGYGAINGALALPSNISRAAAPFGAALIWTLGGYPMVLWAILAGALIAAVAFWIAARRD
jgi:MFS family permease